jgi:predicted transcriptional regulator
MPGGRAAAVRPQWGRGEPAGLLVVRTIMIVPVEESEERTRRRAGELESEILGVLVAASAPLTPREVLDELGPALAYSTVVTILTRLHEKGMAARYREGRSFRYAPLTDADSVAAGRMNALLGGAADRTTVLRRFVDELEPGDADLLRRLMQEDS